MFCLPDCSKLLITDKNTVITKNKDMTASSIYNSNGAAYFGYLGFAAYYGSWFAAYSDNSAWLRV